ncbi:tRNA-His guanylyltransferase [Friedmanniomyces endolithicus]|uniref:tRNA(His) guanylyltransferase n=1 Tax=Friedmanniomyces endolithicus TaxID=329885 RepID=A0AAN6KFN3_9PEZI|nr:tRNA-His guanylyltransferase [Friedmanniomyces endolithicus]KAK0774089.1 tRNA-His guanylyltransferase [Friedmanniomyces endolithicus]KAK0803683.1 tRNA-His guanylyltransferase [Friedmanniomyces endolithicus]KAK0806214.1 tRNA-His guanylyltransferase [Friedmanniomyces endolithicus]KAK0857266.1 tRNA-His guanylyltransferase [Friedmanniomyces endolithicus]
MANSEYGYVRNFEVNDILPPSNWIVVRIDGRGFSKLCKKYNFDKPNDRRALDLMNAAATEVVRSFVDVVLAYGQSDEYSFVFHESTGLFERRAAKLATSVATAFTAEYCMQWSVFFPDAPLSRPYPTFDGRCVCYPKRRILRDYLSWRQADCHINNLYNTTFWNMVLKGGMSTTEAEQALKGTVSSDKNEILFSRFGINYNSEPEAYRKGTVVYRSYLEDEHQNGSLTAEDIDDKVSNSASKTQMEKERKRKQKAQIINAHPDIIGDTFWTAHPYILASKRGQDYGE